MSTTLDIWTDRKERAFMGVTVHFLDENFQMQTHCLGVERMKGSHTGNAIHDKFHCILLAFGIDGKVVRGVSDDASNMRKAFELQLFPHIDLENDGEDLDEDNLTVAQQKASWK